MKKIKSFKNINTSKAPPILLSVITVGAIMETGRDISEGKTTIASNVISIAITLFFLGLTLYFWLKKNGNFE